MTQFRQDLLPIGGLNTDDDPRHFEQGDYLDARNLHVGDPQAQGEGGLVETIISNLETAWPLPNPDAAVSTKYFMGAAVDEENDAVYILAIVNALPDAIGDPGGADWYFIIYKHNLYDDTIKVIFFQLRELWGLAVPYAFQHMYNPRIVDGKLIFTDNVNDIRQFDVDRLENTYDEGITEQVLEYKGIDYADAIGYPVGTIIYYIDRVYKVILNPGGWTIGYPADNPTYYQDIGAIVDLYLHIDAPAHFTLIALPSLISPLVAYNTDASRKINQIKGRTWQFSYRYIYLDWRRSTFAPPSLVPPPSQEEDNAGVANPDQTFNNNIDVTYNTGTEDVRLIELVVRSSDDPATWFIWESVEVINDQGEKLIQSGITQVIKFYNDSLSPALTTADVINLFSFVPIRAKHMELIEGNRLVFANITEGYSHIETDVSMVLSWENLAGITTQKTHWSWFWKEQDLGGGTSEWQTQFTLPTSEPSANGDIYIRRYIGSGPWEEIVHTFVVGALTWPLGVRNALSTLATAEWGAGEVDTCWTPSNWNLCLFPRTQGPTDPPPYYFPQAYAIEFYIESNVVSQVDKYSTLKTGCNHEWGIIYRDIAGRIGPINGANQITTYIPFATESNNYSIASRPNLEFQINHLPPDWAASWEIVYAGNKSMHYFLHGHVYNWAYGKRDHDDSADIVGYDPNNRSFRVRIKASFSNTRNNLPGWVVEEYFWQKGDRIRIFGKADQSTGAVDETPFEPTAYIYDAEITGAFTDKDLGSTIGESPAGTEFQYEWIYFNVDPNSPLSLTYTSGSGTNKFPDNLFIEIYRPFTVETGLFFTTGMTYLIGVDVNGNKFHYGDDGEDSRFQVLTAGGLPSVVAQVANTSHDAWKYLRSFRTLPDDTDVTVAIWAESQYASDFNQQQILNSQGFPIPFIASAQQNVLPKRMRHGGAIAIGSQVNNIADFEFDDFLDLKDEDGPIEGIREVGFTLKAVQYTRITSVYISRQESFTAAGDAQYLFTDKVFGSTRPSLERWGSSNPDSIIVNKRNLYLWDQSEGIVVRDSPNGQIAISDNKMKQFFTDKARAFEQFFVGLSFENDRPVVTIAYSEETEEVFITFGDLGAAANPDANEVIVFSEKDQRWKYKVDMFWNGGQFYSLGKRMFMASNAAEVNLYEWWRGTDYLTIAGVEVTGLLAVYATGKPQKVQTFDAIHVYQTNETPVFGQVIVPIKAVAIGSGEGDMETIIQEANIVEREGIFYCEVMRDINTPEAVPTSQNNRLVNGRRLRGLYMYFEIIYDQRVQKVTLSNIAVITTPSERSQ